MTLQVRETRSHMATPHPDLAIDERMGVVVTG